MSQDKNFDDLVSKFSQNIYATLKGRIRLAVLQRDLEKLRSEPKKSVLDAGGGMGQMASWFAKVGHEVLLTDISEQMLDTAARHNAQCDCLPIQLRNLPLQGLDQLSCQYDLVMCHAVLEWVSDQRLCLQQLVNRVKPGGTLSLMVFNYHGLLFHNLTAGNLVHVEKGMKTKKKKLVPTAPLNLSEVEVWLETMGMARQSVTGVRVFNDYIRDQREQLSDQQIIDMELRQSRVPELIPVSRYLHLIYKKPILHSGGS